MENLGIFFHRLTKMLGGKVMANEVIICDGLIAAITGAIAGGIIGYFGASQVARKLTFNQAAAKFRAAFIRQKLQLKKNNEDVYKIFSDTAYELHEVAKIEFEPYLTQSECKNLNSAWERYDNYKNYETQNISPGSIDVRSQETSNALKIIDDLLVFARNK